MSLFQNHQLQENLFSTVENNPKEVYSSQEINEVLEPESVAEENEIFSSDEFGKRRTRRRSSAPV